MNKITMFGAPFDGTTSYRPGTRFGPNAIRNEFYGIENYSPYFDFDLEDVNYQDDGDLDLPFGNTIKVLDMIEDKTSEILQKGEFPLMIGGEHLVTLGAFRAIEKKYDEVYIVHFDAHADLRDDYIGEKLSHATVIRRCFELATAVYQFGIRSGDKSEFIFAKDNTIMVRHSFNGLEEIIKSIGNKPVYLTIDLDVLDPSEFPGTGTPEAGGVSFLDLVKATDIVTKLNVVGADINELSPTYDQTGRSTALACKFLREFLICLTKNKKEG
ncbi:MAG: agmatinase [Oscillospiraceae bacterium]